MARVAEHQQTFPAWKVTTYNLITGQVDFVYHVCGRCSLKENDCPSNKPERREPHQPNGAFCAYCSNEARPC
jgi:hypothetical protein